MTFLTAIALHFIADFPLQSDFLAMNKGKSWEILFYHVAVYVSLFALFQASALQLIVLGISHFIIDALKARYGLIKQIWKDQMLHLLVIGVLFS